ncbi:MAG: hypothetical protein GF408_07630 [Candidatus Omnitrophica bacterium]|nr:hypothetical protein [Candidatus Omnitrophota bacterium]
MNKDLHICFRVTKDMLDFQEELMAEIQKRTSRKVTYSRFLRGQLDLARRDKKFKERLISNIAEIIDSQ